MSSTTSTAPRETLERLVRDQPLSHPLPFSIRHMAYEQAPPEHIREIYGSVYRGLSEKYPRAPKKLARIEPREHAKSEAGTVVIPTWAALRNPNVRILLMSETEEQAIGKLDEVTNHIERLAPQYGRDIVQDKDTALKLERDATYDVPTIQAAGFKTGVTGGHYDLLIFDDLVSWETQRTQHRRTQARKRFADFINLGSAGESVFLVLGTRKHREDLYATLINGPAWDSRVEQAIQDWSLVENGEFHAIVRDDDGHEREVAAEAINEIDTDTESVADVVPHRDVDVLWPERWPLDTLLMDMITGYGSDEGRLVWKRENQNDPGVFEGQILQEEMLTYTESLPDRGLRTYAGVDLAVEDDPEKAAREDTDYWAVAVLEHDPQTDTAYVVDLQRRRGMSLREGIRWVQTSLQSHDVNQILVESNQAQRWFVQTARDEGLRVEQTTSSGSKEERIIDMSSRFESGNVVLYDDAVQDWSSFVVDEWCQFPSGEHDDRLDAIEIALRNLGQQSMSVSKHSLGDLA